MMLNKTMKFILILLFVFTPIAFGSMEIWAFSLMELGILLLIILWSIQNLVRSSELRVRSLKFEILFICLFLILVIFQLIPFPSEIVKILSPKTYELRHGLATDIAQSLPGRQAGEIRIPHSAISFVPFLTRIEFYKWLTLIAFFLFLLHWKSFGDGFRITNQLMLVIFLVGVFESLYGMFEFFSGHHHILYLRGISSVTGTFINRNYFAGYLLMVIPLSMGFFFSREAHHGRRFQGWRQRLSTLDGKTLLIGFGIIVMILGLIFSASRMGILSLLLSFTLISILFKTPRRGKGFSKTALLILGLAVLWALWIGLDAVIGRFFNVSEDLKWRWTTWEDTLKVVKDYPILGTGLGTFSQIFPMYKSFHMRRFVSHAENDFLQLASEVGLIGMGILLILFIFLFVRAVSSIRSMSITDSGRYIGIGGLVGILALMFHSMVERNLQVPANAFLFTFLWALVLRIGSFKQNETAVAGEIK
jgi:O-antigen ligase